VAVPSFALTGVRPGIVHLGFGGFHRAHMARYTHDLMNLHSDGLKWGIIGVGLLAADERMRDSLLPQDGLYTLLERQGELEHATIIGSVSDVVFAGESSSRALQAIESPAIRIVSLTVTENGYCLNPATKQLDFAHPMILPDLATPESPRSAIGIIVEAYRRRRQAGSAAFTALTCDNIQHNGAILKSAVLALAERRDPTLRTWIEANASFPSTMVDRITPVTTVADRQYIASRFGLSDRWPVCSELFRQWVIEDDFSDGRPAWERVGVQFATDVGAYECMKLRLLNASHLALAGLGRLMGYRYIHETLRDESLRAYMQALMDRETGPTIPEVAGIDLTHYKSQLIERFSNTQIKDTVERVNADAPLNLLLDPIRDRLDSRAEASLLALALAAWMRRVRGEDESGQPIKVVHPLVHELRERAIEGGSDPRPLLAITRIFADLSEQRGFVETLRYWLGLLYGVGAKATLARARRELFF
jgi:mannitol 2-dehydrogenase